MLSDLKNLTPNDLSLIMSRLQIIQEVEPYVDDFMRPHMHEAYKDLANMAGL